jgi:hypothetical protein
MIGKESSIIPSHLLKITEYRQPPEAAKEVPRFKRTKESQMP